MKTDATPTWRASKRQAVYLRTVAYEALGGGSAGGGKSEMLVIGALFGIEQASYRALLLRRTMPELRRSLLERSRLWYPIVGGKFNQQSMTWRFPSGAAIELGHLEYDHDVSNYQSAEYQFIGFDELTTFTEKQYVYMMSRGRSAAGLPVQIRAATNPGGIGHDWVLRRWGPWLNPSSDKRAAADEVLHYLTTDDGDSWAEATTPGVLSRTFIPVGVQDNPHIMRNDPGYVARLSALDPLTRAQLRDGNWLAKASGMMFRREWFRFVEAVPKDLRRVRFWDLAASEVSSDNRDPDWTVGVLMGSTTDNLCYIEDVIRLRGSPHTVEQTIRNTAILDGKATAIGIEQAAAGAGKFEATALQRMLAGFDCRIYRVTEDKITRAKPLSAQVEAGNVKLQAGGWNKPFVEEFEQFPEVRHDDQVDAASGAYAALFDPPPLPVSVSSSEFMDY